MLRWLLYWCVWPILRILIHLLFDYDHVLHARIPSGPKVLIANHPTTIDPFLVSYAVAQPVHILITEPIFRAPLLGRYLRSAGHIPVMLTEGRSAFDRALRLLKDGRTVLVFPEGALSPDEGGMHPARTGAARLALAAGVPIVPIGIHVAHERMFIVQNSQMKARGRGKFVLNGPYKITIGRPLFAEGDVEDRQVVKDLGTWMMHRIHSLVRESAQRAALSAAALENGQHP